MLNILSNYNIQTHQGNFVSFSPSRMRDRASEQDITHERIHTQYNHTVYRIAYERS